MSDMSVGLSGMLAAQRALDAIGQNIANASTPGYARREALLSPAQTSLSSKLNAGNGVTVEQITRIKDSFLENRLQGYNGSKARSDVQGGYLAEIEALLQEPSDNGLGSLLDDFYNQWQALAVRPEDITTRTTLAQTAQSLADRLSSLRQGLVELQAAVQREVSDAVSQVNSLAGQLAGNNALIDQYAQDNTAPLSLKDQQDQVMAKLAELIGAVSRSPADQKTTAMVDNLLLVSGSLHIVLGAPSDSASGVTIQSQSGSVETTISGGRIGGLLDLNQRVIPDFLAGLDRLAAGLIESVNAIHAQGIPQEGRFTELIAANAVQDVDGDGNILNDRLNNAGLPFTVSQGTLRINITDQSTGATATSALTINGATQSLQDVIAVMDGIDGLTASVLNGRLVVRAETGFRFDFAAEQGANLLAALGLNSFFIGSDASNISVSAEVLNDPKRIAVSRSTDSGDGSNAVRLAALRDAPLAGGLTTVDQWQGFVAQVGLASSSAQRASETLGSMVQTLSQQEQAISGVSLDEEAAKMLQYQQMYSANARYLSTVSKLMQELMDYL